MLGAFGKNFDQFNFFQSSISGLCLRRFCIQNRFRGTPHNIADYVLNPVKICMFCQNLSFCELGSS